MSRGDEAIAAAEVLVLRDELDSSRRKEAETAKALGDRSEVRMQVEPILGRSSQCCGDASCARGSAQECDTWMTSYKQLELEHAVLQERCGELEARAAANTRAADSVGSPGTGGGQRTHVSAASSADMYAHLANSSDWSARQMGAIEGRLHTGQTFVKFPSLSLHVH